GAGEDAGVFGRAAWLCRAGRVPFPELRPAAEPGEMDAEELTRGLAWAAQTLHSRRAIWHRTGVLGAGRQAALVANYRTRRMLLARPPAYATPAMRLAGALARPIRIRERVPFVSTLVDAMHPSSGQMRSAWLRARDARRHPEGARHPARRSHRRTRRPQAGEPDPARGGWHLRAAGHRPGRSRASLAHGADPLPRGACGPPRGAARSTRVPQSPP